MNDPRLLWWVDRSAGLVSLVLLTLVMLLGIVATGRPGAAVRPRVMSQALHRQLSLVATLLLAVHIATAVIDSYVPLTVLDVVVPFRAAYRPIWIGVGALALDVLVVLVVTSLLRARLGYRAWRVVHTASYALWPLAVGHALGSGSDMHASTVHAVGITCVAVVLAGAGWRLLTGRSRPATRLAGLAGLLALTLAASGWAVQGPLAHGWSKRAAAPVGSPW